MYTKIVFCIIDLLAILDLLLTIRSLKKIKEKYSLWLNHALVSGIVAIIANVFIALSVDPQMAKFSYCMYYVALNWIIFFLCGFCIAYTEPDKSLKLLKITAIVLLGLDSLGMMSNLFFGQVFTIYETVNASGVVFYQSRYYGPYYIHLILDYAAVIVAFIYLIHGMRINKSVYRVKYAIIIGVLLLVVALNGIYMMFSLPLDISVVFYAIAGTLIYFSIAKFVPRSLLIMTTSRAVDNMSEGIMLFDIQGNCIYANEFATGRFCIRYSEITLESYPAADFIDILVKDGRSFGEFRYKNEVDLGNGPEQKYYEIKYYPLPDNKGNTLGSYFVISDRTESANYLIELNKAKEEADRANAAKSTFLANISHEIRTPLNSVLGMNDMILRTTRDPQLIEYSENIQSAGDTLLSLINDILDFAKIEAGKIEIANKPYDPYKILTDINASFATVAAEKDLYLKFKTDESMPKRLVGDTKYIREIAFNLVSNAIKYTKEGGVTVEMSYVLTAEDRLTLKIKVSDTGIGIDDEDIQYLFDKFRRVNESQNASIQGTGLGLSIARELAEVMGGTIMVTSTPGEGSTFILVMPQTIADKNPIGPFDVNTRKEKSKYQESFHAPDATVLVVDDVSMNLKVMNALLKATMIKVENAQSADQAIEMCKDVKYDLVLMDHRMPVKDGIEAFKEIRQEGLNTLTPVVMLTANAISGAEEEYLKLGFSGYLTKPVKAPELEAEIARLLPKEKVKYT